MTILESISILLKLKKEYSAYINTEELLTAIDMAISALEKQIPAKLTIKDYTPVLCPSCNNELSEHLRDGYYKHHYYKSICNCGQKLRWD